MSSRGAFITLEGIEGAGKSTCMALVRQLLQASGLPFIETREPGGTLLGEELRALLLDHRSAGMSPDTELLLMFAARSEHLQQKILPAMEAGRWVLCDRFTDATYAYQGGGRGIPAARIRILEEWVQKGVKPDLTLLLDLPPEIGLTRAGKRSTPDRFETEALSFFNRVRQAYLDLARAEPGRIRIVDASRPLPEVEAQVAELVREFVSSWH